MTTPITLTVGAITLTFNKWEIGVDHGMLFQESDRQRRRHPDIDYRYYDEHPEEDPAQSETCFCRSLGSMLPRLELLGYSLATVKADPDGHPKLPHLWPVKLLQAGQGGL